MKLYTSTNSLTTSYVYDTYGRLSKVTNPLGLTNDYTYDASGRVNSIKDYKGGITKYTYDAFGRESLVQLPDETFKETIYAWSSEGTNGLYSITTVTTGKPTVKVIYDPLNREVRSSETRFNGTLINTDKLYDSYGNLQKVSLPFPGNNPSLWNTYTYDNYDRMTSFTEASGRKTTYSYNANSVTTVTDKVSVTRNYDGQGNLISATDPAGTIVYNLHADGQPLSIVSAGYTTTSFSYDKYRRRSSLTDPSSGTTSYEYDAAGNIAKETNSNGEVIQYVYDSYNRLYSTTTPEFKTTYTYNSVDELIEISTNNGTSKTMSYDSFGRILTSKESIIDNKWLQKNYTYSNGNIFSIKYTSQSGVLATEYYTYSNGHLSELDLNGKTIVYKLSKENSLGQTAEVVTGNVTRKFEYSPYGLPSGRNVTGSSKVYQNVAYTFDETTLNLSNRKDLTRNITENFTYDNLNRLTSYAGKSVSYDTKGNIIQKNDVGTFEYNNSQKPYAVTDVSFTGNEIPTIGQNITYNSFKRPNTISENGYVATFTYNGEYEKVKMNITKNNSRELTRYYLSNCYELDETNSSTKEKLYLFGNYYNSPVVLVKEGSESKCYNVIRDYLGSITQIVAPDGTLVQELSYDAWGRLRNPVNQTVYTPSQEPVLFLGRGYSGHEYLSQFGLVNMNARLYDPVLGRFLSPDPYVQAPDFSQNFNRYTYAMNNPLKYVDQDGEFLHIIIGALVGGTANLIYKAVSGQLHSFKDGFVAFGIGAAAGGIGAATGGLAFAAAGGAAGGAGGFIAGAAAGAAGTASMMPVQSAGNTLYFGDPFMSLKDYALGIAGGAFTSGVINGTIAGIAGRNVWTGDKLVKGQGMFSLGKVKANIPEMKNIELPEMPAGKDMKLPGADRQSEKMDEIIKKLKQNLIERTDKQEFNSIIQEGDQKVYVRVETHDGVNNAFPGMDIKPNEMIRHMNVEYYERSQSGKWILRKLPGQSEKKVHIFLNRKK